MFMTFCIVLILDFVRLLFSRFFLSVFIPKIIFDRVKKMKEIYMYIYVCIYIHIYVYTYLCIYISMYIL